MLTAASLLLGSAKNHQDKAVYVLDKKIPIPGNDGYDYLTIDKKDNRLYVSHGSSVQVIDLASEQLIGSIDGLAGVHGIAIASEFRKGYITDGKSNTVIIFDLLYLRKIVTIRVTGTNPDAIIYDPYSKKIYAFNADSHNASVIDALTNREVGTIDLKGSPEFAVADGQGKIYNNLEDINSLAVIDIKSAAVKKLYSLIPSGIPTGLAMDGKNHRLFAGCRFGRSLCVLNEQSGKVIARVPIGAKVDAVAYDPETKLIFCSNGDSTTTIIRQETPDYYKVIQTLGTQVNAKTMALDQVTHKIYLSAARYDEATGNRIPNSFEVLVYKMQ